MILHAWITDLILKSFYNVYHELGYGFLEKVYENALCKELIAQGLKCEAQKEIKVYYKGDVVGTYYADLLVEDCIILELKAVAEITPGHKSQLMNYLKATGIEVGLVLNFGPEPTFSRKIFSKQQPPRHGVRT